jgi:acyl-CoA synthetase (NDP forming)
MVRQAGAVEVGTIEELIEVAATFYFLPPMYRNHVGVAGGSGGSSVMGADQCEEAGLDVVPLPREIREELKRRGSPIWDWISNPADFSISMESFNAGEIVQLMADHPDFDMIIMYMSPPHAWGPRNRPVLPLDEHLKQAGIGKISKPVIVVLQDRGRGANDATGESLKKFIEFRDKLIENRLPTYPDIGAAANAAAKMVAFFQSRNRAVEAACL